MGLLGAAGAARSADNLVFVPLPPCRVIDTRALGAGGALVAGTPRSFVFRGPTTDYQNPAPFPNQGGSVFGCGIPGLTSGGGNAENLAKAVAINIVAVGPAGAGDLRAWPANQSVPNASVINYAAVPGLNIANGVIVPMCDEVSATPCTGGDITFRADVSGTQLVVDVVGYFHAGSTVLTVTNTALGHLAMPAITTGQQNTALGANALEANSTGISNTATGYYALAHNTGGNRNTASGAEAMFANTTGSLNVAVGYTALSVNTSGQHNTAVGSLALSFAGTSANTAVGAAALFNNTTGAANTALGYRAGYNVSGGSNNILIGNEGTAADAGKIRIGSGAQSATFVAGIRGVTTGSNDAVAVLIDSNGQLGTVSSSIRFKEDVHDLGAVADRVLSLRPVSFRYKHPFANGEKPVQYGLIAEEVEKVLPELVAYGKDGKPETVKYQILPTLLLGELEREHAALLEEQARSREQGEALARAQASLAEQDRRLRDLRQEKDAQLAVLLTRIEALENRSGGATARAAEEAPPPR